jgi:phage tail sheath protein FI
MTTTPSRPGVFVTTTLNPLITSTSGIPGEAIPAFALPYNRGPIGPVLVKSWQQFTKLYGDFPVANGSLLHYAVYQFFANNGNACYVLRCPNTDASYASTTLDGTGGDAAVVILTVKAISPGVWGNQLYVTVNTTGVPGRVNVQVYSGGNASSNVVENWVDLSMNPADPRNIAAVINSPVSGSAYVTVSESLGAAGYIAGTTDLAVVTTPQALTTGSDGTTAPSLGTYIPTQLDTLPNQILDLNIPGWTTTSDLNTVIAWAQGRGDVFVVIDGPAPSPPATSAQVATNYVNMTTSGVNATVQAAIYGPWLQIADPASAVPGAMKFVPPGGAVLGLWSYNDSVHGVQKTPAGIQTPLRAISLEANFTATDLNNLQTAMINPIKNIPGAGICVFGGLTLSPGYPSQFIAVERTLQMLVHDLQFLCQFAIFEPNTADLWAQITAVLTNYLTQQMQSGVLAGNTPQTSFAVICDATNNTLSSAQTGLVNVQVAVALASPAEFIVINLSQFQGTTTATVVSS